MIFTSRDFPYPQRMGFASGESPPPREWYSPQGDSLSTATGIPLVNSEWNSHQLRNPLQENGICTKRVTLSKANGIRIKRVTLSKVTGNQPRVGLEDSGVVSWIVESLRVGFRIPFDRRPPYPSGFSLPDSVIASAHRYSRLNQGTSSHSSEGTSRNSLSVSRLLQQFLPHPEGFGVWHPIIDFSS